MVVVVLVVIDVFVDTVVILVLIILPSYGKGIAHYKLLSYAVTVFCYITAE